MKIVNLFTASAVAVSLTLAGCTDDIATEPAADAGSGPASFAVSLGVVSQPQIMSRSDMFPHENGFENENRIEDAVIIIYDTPLNTVSQSSPGKIVYMTYLNDFTKDGTYSQESLYPVSYDANGENEVTAWSDTYKSVCKYDCTFSDKKLTDALVDGTTYYMVAIANCGDLTSAAGLSSEDNKGNQPIGSLLDLHDYVYKGGLYRADSGSEYDNPAVYHKFAMSALGETQFTYRKSDIKDEVYEFARPLYVQRLAARIDLVFGNAGSKSSDLADSSYDYVILKSAESTYPFNKDVDKSVYFPIYDAANGKRITGAVMVLDEVSIIRAVNDITGEYLIQRNNYEINGNSDGVVNLFGSDVFCFSSSGTKTGRFELGYAGYFVYSPPFCDVYGIESQYGTNESHTAQSEKYPNSELFGATGNTHTVYNTDGTSYDYAVLGYVRENTFKTYDEKNRYTTLFLGGRTNLLNAHFQNQTYTFEKDGKPENYAITEGTLTIKHCKPAGEFDPTRNLAYATVRNTIYRIKVKFYARGNTVYARYYYYGTRFDGNDSKDNPEENGYTEAKFGSFVLEGDGTTPND